MLLQAKLDLCDMVRNELNGTYGDLQDQAVTAIVCLQGIENGRELFRVEFNCQFMLDGVAEEFDDCSRREGKSFSKQHTVDNGTNDLMDLSLLLS